MPRSNATTRLANRGVVNSLNFNQATTLCDIPANGFDPSVGDWTLLLWVRPDFFPNEVAVSADFNIYSQLDGGGAGRSWLYINRLNNKLANFFGGTTNNSNYTFTKDWTLCTLIRDGTAGTLQFVVNGTDQGSLSKAIPSTTGARKIGSNKVNTGVFFGGVTEVRLYNIALTIPQVLNYYQNNKVGRTGLVEEYLMTNGSGTTLSDSAGTNNATLTSPSWQLNNAPTLPRTVAGARSAAATRNPVV